jgi:hypothetical protein
VAKGFWLDVDCGSFNTSFFSLDVNSWLHTNATSEALMPSLGAGPAQPLGELSRRFRPPKKKKKTLINQGPKIIKKKAHIASIDSGRASL